MISQLEAAILERIRSAIARGEYSARWLAMRAKLSQGYVHLVLSGKRRASAESLSYLATAAGITWSDLVGIVTGCEEQAEPYLRRRRVRGRVA